MRRYSLALVALCVLTALLAGSPAAAHARAFPDTIALPNGWLPEGVAVGHGPVIYSGSRANGAIYAADLRTGAGSIVVPGQAGRVAVGLSYDERSNYLFVAGGPTGKAYVYDAGSGAQVREYTLTAPGTFVNDVIVTREAAYFTDSFRPVIFRVPLGPAGWPAAPSEVTTIALGGDYQQVVGFNANGIEATANGKQLIIVNSTSGLLYLVDAITGVATRIDLGGASVSAGDGLLLQGRTLYVVRNQLNQIAVIELDPDLTSGAVMGTITSAGFDIPTTVAAFGSSLYAVNARFSTPATPTTSYSIVRVDAKP